MPFYLPVPRPPLLEDKPREALTHGLLSATGGPGPSEGTAVTQLPQVGDTQVVTRSRTGPGDISPDADQWMGEDIFVVGREGVMNGEQLFKEIPGPPNEGHGEYGFAQDGPKIDHSTRNLALFWSAWHASTALQAGGRGSFNGQHVVIRRIVPGSTQGYMPTETAQRNNLRDMPGPWDAQLNAARESYLSEQRAATSMPPQGV